MNNEYLDAMGAFDMACRELMHLSIEADYDSDAVGYMEVILDAALKVKELWAIVEEVRPFEVRND